MEKTLLKRIEEMNDVERDKLRELLKDKKSDSDSKLNWMYSDKVDSEEYLLGRRIEKSMVTESEPATKETPGVSFSEVISRRSELDMQVKMREDPLYMIRKREEEAKRKLLENPIKMKLLQQTISQQRTEKQHKDGSKKKKNKKKHRKHRKVSSSDDSDDELLRKYLAIVEQKKSKLSQDESSDSHTDSVKRHKTQIDDRGNKVGRDRSHDSRQSRHSRDSVDVRLSSRDDAEDRHHKIATDSNYKYSSNYDKSKKRDDSVGESHKHRRDEKKQHHRSRHVSTDDEQYSRKKIDIAESTSRSRSPVDRQPEKIFRSRSRSPASRKPEGYGLIRRHESSTGSHSMPTKSCVPTAQKSQTTSTVNTQRTSTVKRKLTAEEMERKRAEMMSNAQQRDEQRHKNIERYKRDNLEEEKRTSKQVEDHDPDFVKPLMMNHATHSSVEDRIKRNAYNIQRTNADLDKHFTKR